MTPSDAFSLRNVSKRYREGAGWRTVLDGASMAMPAGRVGALVGPSGAGKSTILNLLSGMDRPDAGEVTVDGTRLDTLTERERTLFRRTHIGFVFQFYNLVPTLTVEENVRFLLDLARAPDAADRAHALLDRVGLADRAGHHPTQLSGGEQQRVALARAFAGRPAVLFADEPTGNLDAETGARVEALLFDLNREAGTALVVVTHDADLAARCEQTIRLRGGKQVSG